MWKVYLKLLRKTLQVVLVELHDVFNKQLNGDGLHVICRKKTEPLAKCMLLCVGIECIIRVCFSHHLY